MDEKTILDPIPARLNVALSLGVWTAAAGLLWIASHTSSPWIFAAAAIAFSFLGNTIFSLLHESVHGVFHPSRAVNDLFGTVSAAFFPTGFTFQKVSHLGHHRRNRTDLEMFDYYYPEDSRIVKWMQWYGILTGVYYVCIPLSWILVFAIPRLPKLGVMVKDSVAIERTSASAYLRAFDDANMFRLRLELLGTVTFQVALFWLLDLSLAGWLTLYAAFGLNWSSLQYADHAFSVRDVRDGAWNLRVSPLVRAVFLNYHHHLAHHQNPQVPWIHLPRYVDPGRPQPRFLAIWARMWLGPRPAPPMGQ